MLEDQLPTSEFPYYGDEPRGGAAKDTRKKATSLKTQTRVRSTKGKDRIDGDAVRDPPPSSPLSFFCASLE
jgi:hypothetical protein